MPELKKRNRLSDMDYDEISLVDNGANQHAHVVLTKRDSTDDLLELGKRLIEGDEPETGGSRKEMADRHRARVSAGKKKAKTSQRARNFREEKYKRVPKGDPDGGQFDEKDGGSKKSKKSGSSSASKTPKKSDAQKAQEAATKKAEKRAATRKRNQDNTKVREAMKNGTAIVHGSVSQEMWEDLLDKGWKGKPGDKKEALYPPTSKKATTSVTRRLVPSPTGIGYQWETVKKGIAMPKTVVEKRKGTRACGECGDELAADATVCEEHPDARIKKSLVIVRKEESDEDDDLTPEEQAAVDAAADEEDEEDEDDEDVDDSDDEDDDDSEDDDEEEEDEGTPVAKSDIPAVTIEALGAGVTLAENIAKAFSGENPGDAYEAAMTEFNHVMDAAAEQWLSGSTVSKSSGEGALTAIQNHIQNVVKSLTEGTAMPKPTRPQALDGLDLPEDVKNYIASLEGGDTVEKSHKEDIYKGLTPEAAEIVRKSAEVLEENEQKKFSEMAKSYTHVPGDREELAKALRLASEQSPEAFATLKKSLDAANYNLSQSDIFKSHGAPGGGEPDDEVSKRQTAAQKLVEDGKFKTIEEAEAHLLDESKGRAYVATQ